MEDVVSTDFPKQYLLSQGKKAFCISERKKNVLFFAWGRGGSSLAPGHVPVTPKKLRHFSSFVCRAP